MGISCIFEMCTKESRHGFVRSLNKNHQYFSFGLMKVHDLFSSLLGQHLFALDSDTFPLANAYWSLNFLLFCFLFLDLAVGRIVHFFLGFGLFLGSIVLNFASNLCAQILVGVEVSIMSLLAELETFLS